jgi:ankyrin repeat protein
MRTSRSLLRATAVLGLTLLVTAAVPAEAPLADAAQKRDVEQVRALVARGVDINTAQGDGMTALHWAAENNDADIVAILITAGAHLHPTTRNSDYTPLHLASKVGNSAVVEMLLEAGAGVDVRTSNGSSALHFAAVSGQVDVITALLTRGAEVDARESVAGQTPLIFAAAADRPDALRALLAAGADATLATTVVDAVAMVEEDAEIKAKRDAFKAIEWGRGLATGGYADTATVVLPETGDDEEVDSEPDGEDEGDEESSDPTDADRQPASFQQLMGFWGGMTALHHAAREGHSRSARVLIEHGVDVDLVSGDHSTALLTATINGHFDLAMELLSGGADPNRTSVAGAAPLYVTLNLRWGSTSWYPQPVAHRQQETSHLEMMQALLDAGADPNARLETDLWYSEYQGGRLGVAQWGATPFWRAAYGLDVPAMRLLVEYGADPNIATKKLPSRRPVEESEDYPFPPVPTGGPGTYAIHAATGASYGLGFAGNAHRHAPDAWLPALRYLVEELGADVNQRDHNGHTPLHNAASRGDNEAIQYLLDRGADVMAVSRSGQTTVDMANGPAQRLTPFPATLELLEGLGAINNHNCVGC